MEKRGGSQGTQLSGTLATLLRKCIFSVLSVGPVPSHIAFIMDGNRRYAKKQNLSEGSGHRSGFRALLIMLKYCYELGVKYVTVYAFSIENFKRHPEEVQSLMQLMQEKIEELIKEESIVNQYGIRVYFQGKLTLLSEPVRLAAEKAMLATSKNTKAVLLICIAYTSTNEMVHAVQESCEEKLDEIMALDDSGAGYGLVQPKVNEKDEVEHLVGVTDVERHMFMAVAPDPNIIIRTSGETRLSNFLLWQSTHCLLYSPRALWPEIKVWHLVWAVLEYQRNFFHLKEKEKQT